MTTTETPRDLHSVLTAPFARDDIEWRIGRAGTNDKGVWAMCLAYITNRAIMERLDQTVGPENWRNEYKEAPAGGVLCGISIRVGDEWVTKWDGAENTDMEAVKGGLSGAMKRAAVQWGIGRYLYQLPEGWAIINSEGAHFGKTKDGTRFRWDPPELPGWALPGGGGKPGGAPRVNRETGEIHDPPPASTVAASDMIDCPNCGGAMWDNRATKKGRQPDLKCKDKDCDHAIWLKSWRDELLRGVAGAHEAHLIDAEQRDKAETILDSMSPAKMLELGSRVDTLIQKQVLGG